MTGRVRVGFALVGSLFVVAALGCSSSAPAPPELSPGLKFKALADAKRDEVKRHVKSKGADDSYGTATVKENPDVDTLREHTHIGTLTITYSVRKPFVDTLTAYYHFGANDRKWYHFNTDVKWGDATDRPGDPLVAELEAILKKP